MKKLRKHPKTQPDDDWGFDDDRVILDAEKLAESHRIYHAPMSQHVCKDAGCHTVYGKTSLLHEIQEIWDDFNLSLRQREVMGMEVVRSRGRTNREATLIRMFVSTLDGSFIIRLSTSTELIQTRMGDIKFETRDECTEYFNYCVQLFGFSSSMLVVDDEGQGFFDDLDELDGGFFDDLDDLGDSDDDEDDWDTEDDEDEPTW